MQRTFCVFTRLLALFCFAFAITSTGYAQICVDDDGDGWGWDQEANQTCRIAGSEPLSLINVGGLKVTWPANDPSENVSQYEAVGQINGGDETGFFLGRGTEFSVRFSDIFASYNDTICIRVRAVRVTATGNTTQETYSEWSSSSCITVPDAPLTAPQLIELSLIE